jgi:hypothetical protein
MLDAMARGTNKAVGRSRRSGKQPDAKSKGQGAGSARTRTMTVGSTTVLVRLPTKAEARRNIAEGQAALARAQREIMKPGVKLVFRRDVPSFEADPTNPRRVVRLLNGRRETGVFVRGKFKARR